MKALTIWQPWASLIIEGAKPYEFRGWRVPRSIVGQRIVIHAAARKPNRQEMWMLLCALRTGGEYAAETCLIASQAEPVLERSWMDLPLACGLGTAVIGEARNGVDIAREFGVTHVNDSDRDEHANWGWPLTNIEVWDRPIPMRGAQGFWNWPTVEGAML
jgi:hypothetical protein